jgi:hypothetical protein
VQPGRAQRLEARLVLLAPLRPGGFGLFNAFLGSEARPYDATRSIRPDFHDSHWSVR